MEYGEHGLDFCLGTHTLSISIGDVWRWTVRFLNCRQCTLLPINIGITSWSHFHPSYPPDIIQFPRYVHVSFHLIPSIIYEGQTIIPVCHKGNSSSENLSDLLKVTQLVRCRAWEPNQCVLLLFLWMRLVLGIRAERKDKALNRGKKCSVYSLFFLDSWTQEMCVCVCVCVITMKVFLRPWGFNKMWKKFYQHVPFPPGFWALHNLRKCNPCVWLFILPSSKNIVDSLRSVWCSGNLFFFFFWG